MKKANNENGIVYIIVSKIDRNIKYVGSTCDSLSKRLSKHRRDTKRSKYKNYKIYQYFNEHGWSNAEISLLELVNCKTKMELLMRERYWKDHEKPKLNIRNPITTEDERKEQMKKYNNDHIKERKLHYEENKDQINQKTTCPYCNILLIKRYLKTHINKSCQVNLFKSKYMF